MTSQPPDSPPPPNPFAAPTAAGTGESTTPPVDADSRQMAMLAHLLGLLTGFIGPLIIWLIKKDQSRFIDHQGKEALNFQLTLLIAYLATGVIWVLISFVTCGFGTFVPLPLAVTVVQIVFGIMACMKSYAGEWYQYPLTIRMIK